MNKHRNLYKQVMACLREYQDTRDSDIELTKRIWRRYYGEYIRWIGEPLKRKEYISLEDLNNLPREDNIKRLRAAIQNDEKKFIPTSWEVAKKRGWEEIAWRKELGYGAFGGEIASQQIGFNN